MSEMELASMIRVGKLGDVSIAVMIAALLACFVFLFITCMLLSVRDEAWPALVGEAVSLVALALGAAGYVCFPSLKEAAAIKVVPAICNSQTVDEISAGMKTLALEWLEELRPAKKDEE